MRGKLSALEDSPPEGLGDPLPGMRREQSATVDKLRAEYGDALADAAGEGVVGAWRGPIPSVFGFHFINVREVSPSYVPDLESIEPEVREDFLKTLRVDLEDRRMNELLDSYTIHVEYLP